MIVGATSDFAPLLMGAAAMLTAGFAALRGAREDKRATGKDFSVDDLGHGRLGFEERKWIVDVAQADNQRLRDENRELVAQVREAQVEISRLVERFEHVEEQMSSAMAEHARLSDHVERCDADNARLSKELAQLRGMA